MDYYTQMTTYFSEFQQREIQISELDLDIIAPSIIHHDVKKGGSKIAVIGKPGSGKI